MFGIKKPGFTLLELIIVVAIMAIVSLMIIPQFGQRSVHQQREQFVMQFNTLLRHTAVDALATGKIHKIVIDLMQRHITVQQQTAQKNSEGQWIYTTPRRSYAQIPLKFPKEYSIKQCIVEGFDEMSRFTGGTTTTIWFYIMPQGLAQAVTLNILDRTTTRSSQSQQFELRLNPVTVQFRIYDAGQ